MKPAFNLFQWILAITIGVFSLIGMGVYSITKAEPCSTYYNVQKQHITERIDFLKKLMEVDQTEESLKLIHKEMGELTMVYGTLKY